MTKNLNQKVIDEKTLESADNVVTDRKSGTKGSVFAEFTREDYEKYGVDLEKFEKELEEDLEQLRYDLDNDLTEIYP